MNIDDSLVDISEKEYRKLLHTNADITANHRALTIDLARRLAVIHTTMLERLETQEEKIKLLQSQIQSVKKMMSDDLGYNVEEFCNRKGCAGILSYAAEESCGCHINAPCSSCIDDLVYCPVCGWESGDDDE